MTIPRLFPHGLIGMEQWQISPSVCPAGVCLSPEDREAIYRRTQGSISQRSQWSDAVTATNDKPGFWVSGNNDRSTPPADKEIGGPWGDKWPLVQELTGKAPYIPCSTQRDRLRLKYCSYSQLCGDLLIFMFVIFVCIVLTSDCINGRPNW